MFKDRMVLLEDALKDGALPTLETFPCPHDTSRAHTGLVRIVFPEFTCVCPRSGYPDFATVSLIYLPDKLCLELKSWKLYLNSFRMVGTFHETVTAHLFAIVTELLKPKWAIVIGDFLPRGNVDTTVVFETDSARPHGAEVLIEPVLPRCKQTRDEASGDTGA